MEKTIKDAIIEAIEGETPIKDFLIGALEDKEVYDESLKMTVEKALIEEKKEKARKLARINPGDTDEEQKRIEAGLKIQELAWDMELQDDVENEIKEMDTEIEVLFKECGSANGDDEELERLEKDYKTLVSQYKEKKELIPIYLNTAHSYISNGETQKAIDIVEAAKDVYKNMTMEYEEIDEVYNRLCEAICERIEGADSEKKAYLVGLTEEEQQNRGMIAGEDFRLYAKRMKKHGKGKDIAKTIVNVDKLADEASRRWRSIIGMSINGFENVRKNFQVTMANLLKNGQIATTLKMDGVNKTLEGGLPFGEQGYGLGCLQPLSTTNEGEKIGQQYGSVSIIWNPTQIVATLLLGDSIYLSSISDNSMGMSFLTSPSPCSINTASKCLIDKLKGGALDIKVEEFNKIAEIPYIEIQLHGEAKDYGATAIERIDFSSEYDMCNLSPKAMKAIRDNDIGLFVNGCPVTLLNNGEVAKEFEEVE